MRLGNRAGRIAVAGGMIAAACGAGGISVLTASAQERQVPQSRIDIQQSFSPVVKRTAPAVVNVYVRKMRRKFRSPFADDPFFRRFFGRGLPRRRMDNSLGSGVIVTKDGIVVTNYHVIKGGGGRDAEIKVALADRREFDASILLEDEKTDLAILRIEGGQEKFPFLRFADSEALEVGDLVLAIGNPFGVGQTVTSGIVSGLQRTNVGRSDSQSFIQTDAAINPGNSGGALVDMRGRLIGVNTAIFSRSGGSNGIGFAIPSNLVRLVVDSARRGAQSVRRPWFGARLEKVTRDVANALGLDRVGGALVGEVYRGSPADDARVRRGDVIVAVEDRDVADPRAFNYRFNTGRIGERTKVRILRDGRERVLNVALREAPTVDSVESLRLEGRHPFDGVNVSDLTPGLAYTLRVRRRRGVVIVDVEPGSRAEQLGLRSGDVVLTVNRRRIGSADQLARLIDRPRQQWRVSIQRGARVRRLVVPGSQL